MERYEQRRWKLQTLDNTAKEDSKGLCVSYFCPENPDWQTFPKEWVKSYKEGRPNKPVTGEVHISKSFKQDIKYDAKKAFDMITTRLYTKTGKKQLRKSMYEELERDSYSWISLLEYLRTSYIEGEDTVLLSSKEVAMLTPPKTEKQKREIRLSKKFIGY